MKEDITIKEIKEAKAELEDKLLTMCEDFEKKYNLTINHVKMLHYNPFFFKKSRGISVKLDLDI